MKTVFMVCYTDSGRELTRSEFFPPSINLYERSKEFAKKVLGPRTRFYYDFQATEDGSEWEVPMAAVPEGIGETFKTNHLIAMGKVSVRSTRETTVGTIGIYALDVPKKVAPKKASADKGTVVRWSKDPVDMLLVLIAEHRANRKLQIELTEALLLLLQTTDR